MFFHPDDALSVEELLQKIFDERLPAPAKARRSTVMKQPG